MKGDPESFWYLEQFYHDEVNQHHIDMLAAQRLVDQYRAKFIARRPINEVLSQPDEE